MCFRSSEVPSPSETVTETNAPEFDAVQAAVARGGDEGMRFLREESGVRPNSPQSEKDAAILPRAYEKLAEAVLLFKNVRTENGASPEALRPVIDAAVQKVFDEITRRTAALNGDPAAELARMLGLDPSQVKVVNLDELAGANI